MEMFIMLFVMAVVIGVAIGGVLAVVAYLRAVMRASDRGEGWVVTLMRIAFPLFVGVAGCHFALGARRMETEMGSWYWYLNVLTVALTAVGLAHFILRARVRRGDGGDRVVALGVLALVFGVPFFSVVLNFVGG